MRTIKQRKREMKNKGERKRNGKKTTKTKQITNKKQKQVGDKHKNKSKKSSSSSKNRNNNQRTPKIKQRAYKTTNNAKQREAAKGDSLKAKACLGRYAPESTLSLPALVTITLGVCSD
jgi:hypothetical protein